MSWQRSCLLWSGPEPALWLSQGSGCGGAGGGWGHPLRGALQGLPGCACPLLLVPAAMSHEPPLIWSYAAVQDATRVQCMCLEAEVAVSEAAPIIHAATLPTTLQHRGTM